MGGSLKHPLRSQPNLSHKREFTCIHTPNLVCHDLLLATLWPRQSPSTGVATRPRSSPGTGVSQSWNYVMDLVTWAPTKGN